MYYIKLEIIAFLKDCGYGFLNILKVIGMFLLDVLFKLLEFLRLFVYKILSIINLFAGIGFLISFYFGYTIIRELMNGVPITKTHNLSSFLYLFLIPIVINVIKNILKPKDI